MHGEHARLEVEALNPKLKTLEEPQPAAIEQLDNEVIGSIQLPDHEIDLLTGENHRNIGLPFCPHNAVYLTELLFQDMPVEKSSALKA